MSKHDDVPDEPQIAALLASMLAECDAALDLSGKAVERAIQYVEFMAHGDERAGLLVKDLRIDLQRVSSWRELVNQRGSIFREVLLQLIPEGPSGGSEVH